jgi:hypothetical protein
MKTALALLTITLALATSASAQRVTQAETTGIINDRCVTLGNAIMPFLETNAKLADDPRTSFVDRQGSLQIIADAFKLMQGVCGAKTLSDSERAVRAINKWAQQQKPRTAGR